jgi:hypothetical protein
MNPYDRFSSGFFQDHMAQGSYYASLSRKEYDILQDINKALMEGSITVTGELAQDAVRLLKQGKTVTFTEYHFIIAISLNPNEGIQLAYAGNDISEFAQSTGVDLGV